MMLRYLRIILLSAVAGLPAAASAAGSEAVTNFAQSATLNPAGELAITNEIDYDFGSAAAHDITFSLPLSYHDDQGREYHIKFTLTAAQQDGQAIDLKPSVTAASAQLVLPAGSNPTTARHYTVSYTLAPVVLRGRDADILKLSVTGLGWAVPINRATLHLVTSVAPADNVTCFTGAQGSTTGSCTVQQQGKTADVVSYAVLQPGESLSIFGDFPHNSFTSYLQSYEAHPRSLMGLIVTALAGLAVGVALLVVFILYRRRRAGL